MDGDSGKYIPNPRPRSRSVRQFCPNPHYRLQQIYAFGQLEPRDCFAFLYTAGGAKTKCLGAVIYNVIEDYAYSDGVIDLYAEASRISRPFCERHGYTVYDIVHQNHFGIEFEWYRMKKTREAALSPRFARRHNLSTPVQECVLDFAKGAP